MSLGYLCDEWGWCEATTEGVGNRGKEAATGQPPHNATHRSSLRRRREVAQNNHTPHVKYNHNNTSVGGAHLLELLLSFLRGDLEDDEGEYQAVNPALAFDYSPLDDERRS